MLEHNKEKVRLVFKHYPLKMHSFSLVSAVAAEVAGKSGKFWEFHDRLFQESDSLSHEKILDIAVELGFDRADFEKKMKDPAVLDRIQADISDGGRAGVQGIPKAFINGRQLKERSFDAFQKMINSELERSSLQPKGATKGDQ